MVLLFWPFMITSLIMSLLGVIFSKGKFLIISAILIIPMSLYLAATPRFFIWGIIFPFFYLSSSVFIRKRNWRLALLFLLPNFLLIGWLGFSVLTQ